MEIRGNKRMVSRESDGKGSRNKGSERSFENDLK